VIVPDRYATPTAFRRALETRLKTIAAREQTDLQRLRRQVAFDRFLCRLFRADPGAWVLKGGYAMEIRIAGARTTKDIDLAFTRIGGGKGSGKDAADLLDRLQQAAAMDLHDRFSFLVGEATMDLDGAPYGGARYPVDARMAGRSFVRFHLDAGIGDHILGPIETLRPRDWLGFADIPAEMFLILPAAQQFAEKYHAYTLTRADRPNSRVRDLVDMLLLIRRADLPPERVRKALRATFARRGSHPIPKTMPDPPAFWAAPFAALAAQCRIEDTIEEAVREARAFLNPGTVTDFALASNRTSGHGCRIAAFGSQVFARRFIWAQVVWSR
jgi:hypothetical protein